MPSVECGDFRVDLVDDIGGRVSRRTSQARAPVLRRRQRGPTPRVPHGRDQQVADAIRALRAGVPVEFYGPCGVGKTTLLRHLAAVADTELGVHGVYLQATPEEEIGDLLQRLVHVIYLVDRSVRFTPARCAQLLAQARPVVVLDDVTWDPDQLAYLLRAMSSCGVIIATEHTSLGRNGISHPLPGLPEDAALALIIQDLGRPLTSDELPAARRLVAAVGGQPLRLLQAAALVRAGERPFAALADRAERGPAALNQLIMSPLARTERRVLAGLALLGGALLPVDLVGIISNTGQVAESLAELRDRGLVEQNDDRFGLPVCHVEGGRRELIFRNLDLAAAIRDIVGWLTQRDPGSAEPLSLANAVVSLIGFAAERRQWDGVVRLVRVVEPILTLAGRWETCRHILDIGSHAASTSGNAAAEALFHHQQGTLALCLDQGDAARQHLSQALELRLRLGDHTAAAVTQHNLRQLGTPPIPPTPPPTQAVPQGQHRGRLLAAITAAVLAVLALGVGVAVATNSSGSSGDGWSPVIETSSSSAPRLTTINVTPHDSTLAPGGTRQLTVVGTYSDGSTGSITGPVGWRSNATGVATVDAAGLIAAKSTGTATITASAGNVQGSATVAVSRTAPTLTTLTVTPTDLKLTPGETRRLTAVGGYSDGSTRTITGPVKWRSNATRIATVDAAGLATAKGTGTATITASAGTVQGSVTITVDKPTPILTAITVEPVTSEICKTTVHLIATGSYSDGPDQVITNSVDWKSDAPDDAAVDANGLVTRKSSGTFTVTISASSGNVHGEATVYCDPIT